MQPPHHHSRINLADLKAQIVKELGPERSKQYFYLLNRFLSLKLSKVEFNKLCLRIIGRENIPLHNQLIHSILKNACCAKTPPPANQKDDVLKHGKQLSGKDILADGYQENRSHTNAARASDSPGLSNGGDMLPLSPRKARTGWRTGDRRSALGPNGNASFAPHQSDFNVVLENGTLNPSDMGMPLHQSGNENEILAPNDAKMTIIRRSPDISAPSCSKEETELVAGDDTKEASVRSPLRAPLGVPLCPVSIGSARRTLPLSSSSRCISTSSNCALLDGLSLRERMQQIALIQGLEGVSVDSANMLNHCLDAYMKGLIRSCIDLVGSRSGHELVKNNTNKHSSHSKLINGVKPGHQFQMQHNGKASEVQEQRTDCPISLQDFRVAMELNPQKLGEDWPLLLEKICTHAFEE